MNIYFITPSPQAPIIRALEAWRCARAGEGRHVEWHVVLDLQSVTFQGRGGCGTPES